MSSLPSVATRLELVVERMQVLRRAGEEVVECDVEWLLELATDARERIRELARQYVAAELAKPEAEE